MVKNFRLQLIPLAQTPTVSNVRRFGRRIGQQIPTITQESRRNSAPNRLARQESSQSSSTGSTLNHSAELYQLDGSSFTILDEPMTPTNDMNSYNTSEALTIPLQPYSEPYRCHIASTHTRKSDTGMFKSLAVGTCCLDNQFLSSLRLPHSSRLQSSHSFGRSVPAMRCYEE